MTKDQYQYLDVATKLVFGVLLVLLELENNHRNNTLVIATHKQENTFKSHMSGNATSIQPTWEENVGSMRSVSDAMICAFMLYS